MNALQKLVLTLMLIYVSGVVAFFLFYLLLIYPLGVITARIAGQYYYAEKSLFIAGKKYPLWRECMEHLKSVKFILMSIDERSVTQ